MEEPPGRRSLRRVRISVVGSSGSGKTTLGRAASDRLGVPFLELDSIQHGPNWSETPRDEFRARVKPFVDRDAWVVDGSYSSKGRDLVWRRATHVIWLDLNRALVMRRVLWRSVKRATMRTELWNGNREQWRMLLDVRQPDHLLKWTWTTHSSRREKLLLELASPECAHLEVVRMRVPADGERWLASL